MPRLAHLALLTACFFWAGSFIATKISLEESSPLMLALMRHVFASLCFIVWLGIKKPAFFKKFAKLSKVQWLHMFVLSLFAVTFHHVSQIWGMQYTTAANASIYAAMCPVIILVLGALVLDERITRAKSVGIGLAFVGALTVSGINHFIHGEFTLDLLGDFLVFLSIATWACFSVWSKKWAEAFTALELMAVVTFLGTLTLVFPVLPELNQSGLVALHFSLRTWLAIAFLGVSCSFLANLLYVIGLKMTESQKAGVYLYTIPPMTAIMAVIVLGEGITLSLVLGTALVFTGVFLARKG